MTPAAGTAPIPMNDPMPEEQYTRCPSCRTVFRVTPPQLAMRAGQVRCGHCQTVFDGVEQLVSLAPRAEIDDDHDDYDEAALGPPTVTLRNAQALLPSSADAGGAPRRTRRGGAANPAEAGDDGKPTRRVATAAGGSACGAGGGSAVADPGPGRPGAISFPRRARRPRGRHSSRSWRGCAPRSVARSRRRGRSPTSRSRRRTCRPIRRTRGF